MLNLNSVMLGTTEAKEMVAFYEKVFGKPADMVDTENGFWGNSAGLFWGSSTTPKWSARRKTRGA
jgi:hypothetical protein